MDFADVKALVANGESDSLEFKKSTGQLSRAAEYVCAFLNRNGGTVLIGVSPAGKIVGQIVADDTLRDVAETLKHFDPPAPVQIERIAVPGSSHEVLALQAAATPEHRPFTFNGRAYERIGSTTSVMPQRSYDTLVVERVHTSRRWENIISQLSLRDLDHEEILRTVRLGISSGRLSPGISEDPGDVLDRMGLRVDGQILNAAVVVFGRRLLPYYPQCQLRMARFRGIGGL